MSKKRDPFANEGKGYASRQVDQGKGDRPAEQALGAWRVGQRVIDRVDDAAERYDVQKGQFVAALIIDALNQLEAGDWNLPTKPPDAPQQVDLDRL